jgi:uncharacterized hydrophobic protein (TIGR00271 family)
MTENSGTRRFVGITVRISPERQREVRRSIVDLSTPTGSFYAMVAISTIIAAYGLLASSTAVVIGAMLVAPLMGPIFGLALAVAAGDRRLLPRAATSEALGVVLAVALGAVIGLVPLRLGLGPQVLLRTQPTLYDLLVALASGLAGAYALVDKKLSPALPGVAISTSLVPPLATCGLCLSAARWDWAGGAFLLFFANLLTIELAAALVFVSFGVAQEPTREAVRPGRFLRRFSLSLALFAVVAVFLTRTLVKLAEDHRLQTEVQQVLSQRVRATGGAELSDLRYERHGKAIDVVAVVLTPQGIDAQQVMALEDLLRKRVNPRIHLVVSSLISQSFDRRGMVYVTNDQRERQAQVSRETRFLTQASRALDHELQSIAGARIIDLRRETTSGTTSVTAVVRTPTAITPAHVAAAQAALQRAVRTPVTLVVRSILVREADAQHFLYAAAKAPQPPTGGESQLKARLTAAIAHQAGLQVAHATVDELRYVAQQGRLRVFAIVRAPRVLRPYEVGRIQTALRRYVDPHIDLVIRSVEGANLSPTGYVQ